MKQINKYKHLNRFKGRIRVSNRLLKFKRPKWNIAKKTLFKTFAQSKLQQIYNQNVLPGWEKTKKSFKNRINLGRYLLTLNNNNRRKKSEILRTKFTNKNDKINTIFFKRFFELDFFLYSVYLTSSVNESRKAVESKKIFKNDVNSNLKKNLKKGDLIISRNNNFEFIKIKEKFNFNEGLNSFYEYDYYTQSFIVLKNFKEVNKKDIYISTTNFI